MASTITKKQTLTKKQMTDLMKQTEAMKALTNEQLGKLLTQWAIANTQPLTRERAILTEAGLRLIEGAK